MSISSTSPSPTQATTPPDVGRTLVAQYLREKSVLGWTAATLRLRTWQLGSWLKHLDELDVDVDTAGRVEVIAFLADANALPTRRSLFAAVRMFYQWGRETGQLTAEPTLGVQPPKTRRGTPNPIPDDLFWTAHDAADTRIRAMLVLARFAGLRCIEISTAHRSWLAGDTLRVPGKGGHVDPIPAHPRVAAIFEASDGWLFPSRSSKRKVPHLLSQAVIHLGNRHLAIHAPGWTMHKLRHAFITEVYERSGDLGVAQTAARHSEIMTTRGYARLNNQRLSDIVRQVDSGRVTV